ncbi:MAG: hypothetical protein ACX94C_07790 [Phycisphaerales bacterium]
MSDLGFDPNRPFNEPLLESSGKQRFVMKGRLIVNPTPPQPPEMPKPTIREMMTLDAKLSDDDVRKLSELLYRAVNAEAEALQQRERAEKAEAECVANHKAYADLSARLAEKTMENARLRELVNELDDIAKRAKPLKMAVHGIKQAIRRHQALHPTPEATPHEEAGETTDE